MDLPDLGYYRQSTLTLRGPQSRTCPPGGERDRQFRLLGELFTNPGLEATVGALTERLGVPQATVSREVARLAVAGLLHTRRKGNRTLVTAALETSIAPELQAPLGKLYGPPARIRAALAAVPGCGER